MSQMVACVDANGVVLASDSQAVQLDPQGKEIFSTVDRLFQLTPRSAILTGGAPEGTHMCRALRQFLVEEELDDVEDVYNASLPFLATEFERFMRRRCEEVPLDPIHQLFFILGGHTRRDTARPFRLYLLWTKRKRPILDGDEISHAFMVPRGIRFEHRLTRLCRENAPLDRLLGEVRLVLEESAKIEGAVAAPFSYALVDSQGFREAA